MMKSLIFSVLMAISLVMSVGCGKQESQSQEDEECLEFQEARKVFARAKAKNERLKKILAEKRKILSAEKEKLSELKAMKRDSRALLKRLRTLHAHDRKFIKRVSLLFLKEKSLDKEIEHLGKESERLLKQGLVEMKRLKKEVRYKAAMVKIRKGEKLHKRRAVLLKRFDFLLSRASAQPKKR